MQNSKSEVKVHKKHEYNLITETVVMGESDAFDEMELCTYHKQRSRRGRQFENPRHTMLNTEPYRSVTTINYELK